jgi:hypothetical protein
MENKCRVRGCSRPVLVKTHRLCSGHYKRLQRDAAGITSVQQMEKWLRDQKPVRPPARTLLEFGKDKAAG